MSNELLSDARLKSEAEFQNQRVLGGAEARDRFYYLSNRALEDYQRTLEDVAGQDVLVAGCSEGGVTPLARRGARVTGIDIASEAITRLTAGIEREGLQDLASAKLMNAEDLTFPDNSFDLICCTGVVHHLDIERTMPSWVRVLRPGGRVSMNEPMAWHPAVAAYRALTPSMRTPDEHPLTPKDIKIFRRYFEEVTVRGYVLTSLLSLPFALRPQLSILKQVSLGALERLDDSLVKRIPQLAYFCWTAVIELSHPKKASKSPSA